MVVEERLWSLADRVEAGHGDLRSAGSADGTTAAAAAAPSRTIRPRFETEGSLADTPLPTIERPHGKASAAFHLILATAWARDPHLVRDVTIATTLEL